MSEPSLPPELEQYVSDIKDKILPGQMTDDLIKYQGALDRSRKLSVIITAWERQHTEERKLRRAFAIAIFILLALQTVMVNLAFFLIGTRLLFVEVWVANGFIISVFVELVALSTFVFKYLFNPSDALAQIMRDS